MEGRTRFSGLQRVDEGAKRRQGNRGGGRITELEASWPCRSRGSTCFCGELHVDVGPGLLCQLWSHLHSWKTLQLLWE